MSSVAGPFPQGRSPHGRGFWLKGSLALAMIAILAWFGLVATQYFLSGKPIADISAMPDPIGRLVQEQPQFSASLWNVARPLGVAVGPDGTVYVTESAGEHVTRAFAADGTPKGAFTQAGSEQLSRSPTYVAVSPSGDVYVSDLMRRTIFAYSASGEPRGEIPPPTAEGWLPVALAFDKAGYLYITDLTPGLHRVLVLDRLGALVRQFGKEGQATGEFSFPNGIAIDAKGNIFVADSGNGRVQAFSKDGAFLFAIGRGTAKGDLAMPRGIAIDDGRKQLLVVDTTDQAVNVYDISGPTPKFVYTLNPPAGAVGGFRFPNGIALDGKGHIFVTDRENHRVAVWRY